MSLIFTILVVSAFFFKNNYRGIRSLFNPSFYKNAKLIKIKSSFDEKIQLAYWYKSTKGNKKPLIVSLHTWGGTYKQVDSLFLWAKKNNWNYIYTD